MPLSKEAGAQGNIPNSKRLREVCLLFLKLGTFAFGGPVAYIAMMRDEVVKRRHWIDDQKFLDLVGATNLIPGPNASEMAIHLGLLRAGWGGYIAAGALFILPGMVATLALAWFYVKYSSMPQIGWVLYGVKPAVIAILVQALWGLGTSAFRGPLTAIVGATVVALYLLGVNEIVLLFSGAAIVLLARMGGHLSSRLLALVPLSIILTGPFGGLLFKAASFSYATLFLTFLKIGSVLYGSGYVLLAFLRADFVERLGWLSPQQLLDAVAVGQVTPGPVLSSATFVGYLVGGWPAAFLATLGIFLPSFFFVALLSRILPLVRGSPWARAFLDGVNAASLGLMAGVLWQLGRAAIVDWFTFTLSGATLLLALRFKASSVWLVLGSGLIGMTYKMVMG